MLDGFADHQDRAVDRIQLAGHQPPPQRFPQPPLEDEHDHEDENDSPKFGI
jgi:hypothetical protein